MADNLSQLLATALQPLREQWRSPAQAEDVAGLQAAQQAVSASSGHGA